MWVHHSESEQLAGLAQGQVSQFEELYHRYKQPVFANIRKMVRDPEAAEDLLQEVFLTLWEKRQTLNSDLAGWLFVVSYNKAATYLKKQLREAAVVVRQPDLADLLPQLPPADDALYQQQLALVEAAVRQLPHRKQQAFQLCRFEGKSCEEAAATMGVSVASVRDYLKQATRLVRKYVRAAPRPDRGGGVSAVVTGRASSLGGRQGPDVQDLTIS